MIHYTNTGNPIDFPKKKDIPMLERFAAQSLVESDGELVFSKEKFAELIVQECVNTLEFHGFDEAVPYIKWMATNKLGHRFGVEE